MMIDFYFNTKMSNLSMQERCLFVCHVEISQTTMPFVTIGKPLMSRGKLSWFHNVLTYGDKFVMGFLLFSMCSSKCSQQLFDLSHILCPKLYFYNLSKQPKQMFHKGNPRVTNVAMSISHYRQISPSPKYPSKQPTIKIFIHIKFQNLKKQKKQKV